MENYKEMLQNINTYFGTLGKTRNNGTMSEKKQIVENVKSTLKKLLMISKSEYDNNWKKWVFPLMRSKRLWIMQ
jgi:hypothetical protein